MSDTTGHFDVCAPLPTGTTLLEASAGTGKTWTIGALVARYVAEGVATLDQMLIVTFGRAASQELRERVRAQLVTAERVLGGEAPPEPSDLLDLLLDPDSRPDPVALRHRRIVEALAQFDGATIATTHQFCHLVLDSLGVAGDSDPQARLVEDLDDLLGEVVADLYLRAFGRADAEEAPEFSFAEAQQIARRVVGDPQALIAGEGRRAAFAEAVRGELDRRKRRLGILSYDDLLIQLADALEREDSPARVRMRQRWKIVLVDEFQDTDPVQWRVLDRAFSGHATMVLIGDPKQAIYAFRGGDVTTYLQASQHADTHQTLGVNRRSDAALLTGLQVLFEGAALGDRQIVVRDVVAHHPGTRLVGAPSSAPFRLRVLRREDFRRRGRGALTVKQVRPHIARDLALDIRALLTSGATFEGRPVQARDVAVIAHKHDDLARAQQALREVGVPAVIAGGGSVFATPAGTEWLALLEGLEQPHRSARVRAAALTSFFGHTAADIDRGGDDLTDEVADVLRAWAEVFALRGVAAVLEAATAAGLDARVLARVGGERDLTDLRHIGEALHEVGLTERLGPVATLSWLRAQVAEGRTPRTGERTRRLDSDAAAVQLVTIHASKGLEYPIVYLPSVFDRFVARDVRLPLFHDDAGRRCLDVVGSGPDWPDHAARSRDEDAGESLRLLYVAATRAQSQVVTWWAPASNAPASPLQRMLFGRQPGQPEVPDTVDLPTDDDATEVLRRWRDAGGPQPELARPADPSGAVPADDQGDLSARSFDRTVDITWRRTSYSSLTRVEPDTTRGVDSEPEEVPQDDEAPLPVVGTPDAHTPSPMADLPVGADFGSLVHGVLEHADPDAADLRTDLLGHIDEQLVRWPVTLDREVLADALVAVCDSPLGPLAGDATLRGIGLADRLRELDFELPLAGGDLAVTGRVTLGDLAPLLRRHLPPGDPVRGFADALDQPALGGQSLRGYLTGSIDVVLRLPGPRFLVVDYKTNWLGPREAALTAEAYAPSALAEAMGHSDYPLQALLYAAVLHRFLRWRLPDYDPATHLGGVLYLYLRGMCGPDTPVIGGEPCGVFSWRPPVALVEELSDLLDGRVVA